jgi:hypothetical protein
MVGSLSGDAAMSDPESVASLRARLLRYADKAQVWGLQDIDQPEVHTLLRDAAERLATLEQETREACARIVEDYLVPHPDSWGAQVPLEEADKLAALIRASGA